MPIGILFWVLMILWLLFGLLWWRSPNLIGNYGWIGNGLFLWFLLFLLGGGSSGLSCTAEASPSADRRGAATHLCDPLDSRPKGDWFLRSDVSPTPNIIAPEPPVTSTVQALHFTRCRLAALRLVVEVEIVESPAGGVVHDEGHGVLLDRPRWREAAR